MAAFAALVSLMNTMYHIQNHRLPNYLDKNQIESLCDRVSFLLDFIENHSHGCSKEGEVLESQIASAAHVAEDVIESHVVDQIHTGSISMLNLQTVIQDMDAVKKRVLSIKEERGIKNLQSTYSMSADSSTTRTRIGKSTMLGFDNELTRLKDELTGQGPSLQIITIVGMAGIGKTILAKNIYESSLISRHFDRCAWATISPECSVQEIFVELISCQSESTGELDGETEQKLGEKIHKSLFNRRYLIILDNMWSIETWDNMRNFFPNNNNGSRIVVTTRLSNIAMHVGSSLLSMRLLDRDRSWKLFCEKAFPQEGCPPELEEIGKKIAKKCEGLPLLIVVIGSLLRKSSRTLEYWENISGNMISTMSLGQEEQSLDILSWSYSHLPAHLKPCFLYMGTFPQDHRIRVSELVNLWVAEGFIRPSINNQSLEEVAEGYLKDLVDRNLILVGKLRWNKQIKTCSIHDLLRELCLKTAQKEKFLCMMRACDIPRSIDKERRIVYHERVPAPHALESASLTRSLLTKESTLVPFNKFKLLRLMNMVDSGSSLNEVLLKQVNLRYVRKPKSRGSDVLIPRELPSSISLVWNLQTLIIGDWERIVAPPEIWEMPQLRHLDFVEICLPDPPHSSGDHSVLAKLHTLKRVVNLRWSDEVCKRMPNIRNLRMVYYDLANSYYCLHNIGLLQKLESLNCIANDSLNRGNLLRGLRFPSSLKKLTIGYCRVPWEDLTVIGSLPHLEFLRLENNAVVGSEWESVEGEFCRLRILIIRNCGELKYWIAESSHFPVLEKLALEGLLQLVEIPPGFGEIPTLQLIHLWRCSWAAVMSAKGMMDEQDSGGDEFVRAYDADPDRFLEKATRMYRELHHRQ